MKELDNERISVAVFATGESVSQGLLDSVSNSGAFDYFVCVSNSYVFEKKFDAIVSSDKNWWDVHFGKIEKVQEKLNYIPRKFSANFTDFDDVEKVQGVVSGINSGVLGCIIARKIYKAKFIGLFGVDLQGAHFFGSHKKDGLLDPSPDRFNVFKYQFDQEKKRCDYEKVDVINFSENSKLECFEKLTFERWKRVIGQ